MIRSAGRLRAFAAASAVALLAALAPHHAEAAPGLATHIVFTSITTPSVDVPATEGAPAIFVTEDRDFTVVAEFHDDSGAQRAAYLFPATAHLFVDGSATPFATQSVPANATGVTFTGLRLPEQNHIRLRMELRTLLGVLIPVREGLSDYFDVQRLSVIAPSTSNPTGIGNGGGTNNPCEPPVGGICADLVLSKPAGVQSDQLGSFGFCQPAECLTNEYIQALVELNPSVYNNNFPMKIVVKCHPTLCDGIVADRHSNTTGGGHNGGSGGKGHSEISHLTLVGSTFADGPLAASPACKYSGKVGSGQAFCTDYAASFRAENGVWHLVWLTPGDARVSFP